MSVFLRNIELQSKFPRLFHIVNDTVISDALDCISSLLLNISPLELSVSSLSRRINIFFPVESRFVYPLVSELLYHCKTVCVKKIVSAENESSVCISKSVLYWQILEC